MMITVDHTVGNGPTITERVRSLGFHHYHRFVFFIEKNVNRLSRKHPPDAGRYSIKRETGGKVPPEVDSEKYPQYF